MSAVETLPPVDDVQIRPFVGADVGRLELFYSRLSPESRYTRFFTACPDVHRYASSDAADRVVLVAESAGEILGIGEYWPCASAPGQAEVAFVVLDRMQHHGLATRLLGELQAIAATRGFREFTAQVLASNQEMLHVFRHSGLCVQERLADGVYDVLLDLGSRGWPSTRRPASSRARVDEAHALLEESESGERP